MRALAHFRHAKHEIIVFQIWDRDELDFPFKQWTKFQSLENRQHDRMVDPSHLRAAYLEKLKTFRESLTRGCHRYHIDLVPLTTDVPYAEALASYVALRRRNG